MVKKGQIVIGDELSGINLALPAVISHRIPAKVAYQRLFFKSHIATELRVTIDDEKKRFAETGEPETAPIALCNRIAEEHWTMVQTYAETESGPHMDAYGQEMMSIYKQVQDKVANAARMATEGRQD